MAKVKLMMFTMQRVFSVKQTRHVCSFHASHLIMASASLQFIVFSGFRFAGMVLKKKIVDGVRLKSPSVCSLLPLPV